MQNFQPSNKLLKAKQLRSLIPQYVAKMTSGDTYRWQWQIKRPDKAKIEYKRQFTAAPVLSDWLSHFEGTSAQRQDTKGEYTRGSIAITGRFEDDNCKFFCIDSDNALGTEVLMSKLLPLLKKHNIEYIYAESGEDGERCHLWVLVDCKFQFLCRWSENILFQAGIDWRDKRYSFELYPTIKENFCIRNEGGIHLKTGKVNALLSQGQRIEDSVDILKAFVDCKQYTQEELALTMVEMPSSNPKPLREGNKDKELPHYGKFVYTPRRLPVPALGLPRIVEHWSQECQAVHELIRQSQQEQLIENAGHTNHMALLYLYNLAAWNDWKLSRGGTPVQEGREWFERFVGSVRARDYEEHAVVQDIDQADRRVPGCKTFERDFNLCGGCPHYGRQDMTNIKKLWYGSTVNKTKIKEKKLVTREHVRDVILPEAARRIKENIASRKYYNQLIAFDRGVGKSFWASAMAIDLARQGKNVLVAVPDGGVAKAWEELLMYHGYGGFEVYSLRSHKVLYNPEKPIEDRNECPEYEPIQEWQRLGVGSRAIRQEFCKDCEYNPSCRFVNQYREVLEPAKKIVIIQHAHFKCQETLKYLLTKNFELLIVDEEFIKNLCDTVKPMQNEVEVLAEFARTNPTFKPVAEWLKFGGTPDAKKKLSPKKEELQACKTFMEKHDTLYRVDEFIRLYNHGYSHDTTVGFELFYPLPDIPVKLLLNATPPLKQLKAVLNAPVDVIGEDEAIDLQSIHPENKVFQNLSGYMSVTSMKGKDDEYVRLIAWLEFIADKARTDYAGLKILVTTYKSMIPIAREWVDKNVPDVAGQFVFNWREKGTNAYKDFQVQFVLAGLYYNEEALNEEVYVYKNILNYWNRVTGRKLIPNPKPHTLKDTPRGVREVNVKMIHKEGNECYEYEYGDSTYFESIDEYCRTIEELGDGETLQGGRLRPNENFWIHSWFAGKRPLKNVIVTDPFLEPVILAPYLTKMV